VKLKKEKNLFFVLMATNISQSEWEDFIQIVTEQIKSHPDVEFLSSIVLALGRDLNNEYKHWKNSPSNLNAPVDVKVDFVLNLWRKIHSFKRMDELVIKFNNQLVNIASSKEMRSIIEDIFVDVKINETPFDDIDKICGLWSVACAINNYCKLEENIEIDTCHLIKMLEEKISLKDPEVNRGFPYHPLKFDGITLFNMQDVQNKSRYFLRLKVEKIKDIEKEIMSSPTCHSGLIGEIGLDSGKGLHMLRCRFVVHACRNKGGDYFFCLDRSSDPNNSFHTYPKIPSHSLCLLYKITARATIIGTD